MRGADAFPALPPAAKPLSTIFGYGTGMVRRDRLGLGGAKAMGGSAWGTGGSNNNASATGAEGVGDGEEMGKGKKKGNKGKKQVLMNWG